MTPTLPQPPWLNDPNPACWVLASVAARVYFRKSIVTVKRYIKTGYLDEVGLRSYWDGTRWYIRIPIEPSQTAKSVR